MFSIYTLFILLISALGISAIYMGAQGTTRAHRLSAISGAIVVFCIAAVPFMLLAAFGNLGGTSSPYEPIFISYAIILIASVATALISSIRLAWLRFNKHRSAV